MNFLFVLRSLSADCGANSVLAMRLAKVLREKGHKVYAAVRIGYGYDLHQNNVDCFDGIISVNNNFFNRTRSRRLFLEKQDKKRKIILFLKNPSNIFAWYYFKCFDEKVWIRRFIRNIKSSCTDYKYDVVLAFSLPFLAEDVACRLNCIKKRGVFRLDPYVHHLLLHPNDEGAERRKKKDEIIISKLDCIFVPPTIYRDMVKDGERVDFNKVHVYNFPGINVVEQEDNKSTILSRNTSDLTIHIYFVGVLYDTIRDPEFVLKLFNSLDICFDLTFIGYNSDLIVRKYPEYLSDKIIVRESVPSDEVHNVMDKADIFLNIGNTLDNLIPSKIFEYINTGKPIINVCKVDNCPTLTYLESYPLCFNIFESKGISEDLITELSGFIKETVGKRVPRREILNKYFDCTDDYVANQIVETFIMDERKTTNIQGE